MRGAGARAVPAALLLLLLLGAARADEPPDDEVESAPFAIVVDHEDGWRCGGSLVSLRVALSSASCAHGRAPLPPADLWARAPGAPASIGARRVIRIAVPIEAEGAVEGSRGFDEAWLGASLDMAVLELESQFGAAARARPILMASGGECTAARSCLAVRTPAHAGAPLRVGNATLAPANVCAAAAPHWLAVADTVMCLTGPQFCSSDWGVGVVCAGKLCGVLSRSARGPRGAGDDEAGAEEPGCGTTHAAQHVPSWRAFVHCAQTRHHCGRDSCSSVCSERMLLEEPDEGGSRGGGVGSGGGKAGGRGGGGGGGGGGGDGRITKGHSRQHTSSQDDEDGDTKVTETAYTTPLPLHKMESVSEARGAGGRRAGDDGRAGPDLADDGRAGADSADDGRAGANSAETGRPTRTPPTVSTKEAPPAGRMAHFEFEPYRADFKIGEYGDNGASYDSGDESPTRTPSSRATDSSRAPDALVSRAPDALVSRVPDALVSQRPLAVPRAPAAPSRCKGTERSLSLVHRNTLLPYFSIFYLFGIYR